MHSAKIELHNFVQIPSFQKQKILAGDVAGDAPVTLR